MKKRERDNVVDVKEEEEETGVVKNEGIRCPVCDYLDLDLNAVLSCPLCGYRRVRTAKDSNNDNLVICTGGFSHEEWLGTFYREGKVDHALYASQFNGCEINATFYDDSVGEPPAAKNYRAWESIREAHVPYRLIFKMARVVTHNTHNQVTNLVDIARAKLQSYALCGGCVCILWQFPPSFHCSAATRKLVRSFVEASTPEHYHAFEFRHSSWFDEGVADLFDGFPRCALAQIHVCNTGWAADLVSGFHPPEREYDELCQGKDFRYLRLHGTQGHAVGSYGPFIDPLASRVREWKRTGTVAVFVVFDNTESVAEAVALPTCIDDAYRLFDAIKRQ